MSSIVLLRRDGVRSQIVDAPKSVLHVMHESFRFRKPGWQYSSARFQGWDGWTNFISKKTGIFLTGLIPEVQMALEQMGYGVEVANAKTYPEVFIPDASRIVPELISIKKNGEEFHLRDYQVDFVARMAENARGVIKSPTGSGKSNIMAAYLCLCCDVPTLVLFRNRDLLKQSYQNFLDAGVPSKRLGICYAEIWRPGRIVLSTCQSLHLLQEALGDFRILMADECHEGITTNSVVPYLRAMKNCTNRFAFSATPLKKTDHVHNYKLKGHFGPVLGELTTKELQERGILVNADVNFVPVSTPLDANYTADYMEAYKDCIAENDQFHDMVAHIAETLPGRTLILVERKEHGERLAARIKDSIWVSGDDTMDVRAEVREMLRSDKGQLCVIATKIFGTGLDIFIHNLINTAGGASDILAIQRMGRGLRTAPDKDFVLYVDFFFETNKHLEKHSKERIRILRKEGHCVKIVGSVEDIGK